MNDAERAERWVDSHPGVIEAAAGAIWEAEDIDDDVMAQARRVLVAAFSSGERWWCPGCGVEWTEEDDLQQVQPDGHFACPLCEDRDDLMARFGTTAPLLDQLEARYEQVGIKDSTSSAIYAMPKDGVLPPKFEPVFRKLPSPEEAAAQ